MIRPGRGAGADQMATILIRNLPESLDEAGLRELLGGTDRLLSVEFLKDSGSATTPRQAVVNLDMSATEAEVLVSRYQGRIVEGNELRISVMHFMD